MTANRNETRWPTNKFVLIPTTTGCGQRAILPDDLAIAARRQINSADGSIVEAEAPTKMLRLRKSLHLQQDLLDLGALQGMTIRHKLSTPEFRLIQI